jgi:Ca2+-binding RTX toxin-like protein
MRIKGSGKADTLVGSSGADTIDGGAGNDTIVGGAGTDYLTGGRGADTFVLHAHSGYDVITDFNPAEGDRVLLDLGGSAGTPAYSGQLWDGLSFQATGGTCYVNCVDINADGVMDTQLSINGDNVFLLGWEPNELNGWAFMGG